MVRATRAGEFEDSPMEHGYGADRNYTLRCEEPPAQQQASAGEVPEWAWDRLLELTKAIDPEVGFVTRSYASAQAFARYIAAHEPTPVDPLVEILLDLVPEIDCAGDETPAEALARQLRARGVTVAKGGE